MLFYNKLIPHPHIHSQQAPTPPELGHHLPLVSPVLYPVDAVPVTWITWCWSEPNKLGNLTDLWLMWEIQGWGFRYVEVWIWAAPKKRIRPKPLWTQWTHDLAPLTLTGITMQGTVDVFLPFQQVVISLPAMLAASALPRVDLELLGELGGSSLILQAASYKSFGRHRHGVSGMERGSKGIFSVFVDRFAYEVDSMIGVPNSRQSKSS